MKNISNSFFPCVKHPYPKLELALITSFGGAAAKDRCRKEPQVYLKQNTILQFHLSRLMNPQTHKQIN